jgi:hypothetical protein
MKLWVRILSPDQSVRGMCRLLGRRTLCRGHNLVCETALEKKRATEAAPYQVTRPRLTTPSRVYGAFVTVRKVRQALEGIAELFRQLIVGDDPEFLRERTT